MMRRGGRELLSFPYDAGGSREPVSFLMMRSPIPMMRKEAGSPYPSARMREGAVRLLSLLYDERRSREP